MKVHRFVQGQHPMRELIEEGMGRSPLDPGETLKRSARRELPKRFYKSVTVGDGPDGGFAILLDGRAVKTPATKPFAAPTRAIAEAIAAEWQAQADVIDPTKMPTTRLANSIIDGITERTGEIRADIAKFFGSDLLFYRAEGPEGLVKRQAEHWDPVLAWAAERLGARFILAEGIMHVTQPAAAVSAASQAIPTDPWAVGALHVVTALTGSALLALALALGFRNAEQAWTASNVEEDWNTDQWGNDDLAIDRLVVRRAEFHAAALILREIGGATPTR
jgi:chaperone required for assembly of F1-ATPase